MLLKKIKFILIIFLLYQTPLYSKSTSFDDFDSKNLSKYFSGIVAFENKDNSEALEFFNSSKILLNKHDAYIKRYIYSLVLENKVYQAINVVKNNKGWELGGSYISINDVGIKSPIFQNILMDDSFYMSHQDVVTRLPKGAVELASNEKGNQSYSIGNYMYGVQFHPEFPYSVTKKYAQIRYDKDGKLISNQRFKNGVQINLDEKNTVFSDKKEFDKIGNLIKKTVYENSKVMLTEEYKFEYYS